MVFCLFIKCEESMLYSTLEMAVFSSTECVKIFISSLWISLRCWGILLFTVCESLLKSCKERQYKAVLICHIWKDFAKLRENCIDFVLFFDNRLFSLVFILSTFQKSIVIEFYI